MARTKQVVRKLPATNTTSSSGHQLAMTNPSRTTIPTKGNRKSAPSTGKVKKPKKRNQAILEIRKYQKGTELLIAKRPFQMLCREISQQIKTDLRFQKRFFEALQIATEAFIVGILSAANDIALHCKRVTLMPRDIKLLLKIRGMFDCGSI